MGRAEQHSGASLAWLFYERIQGLDLPDEVKAYLVLSMVEWATNPPEGGPLALEWLRTLETPSPERFRFVGNLALFRSLGSSNPRYVFELGAAAFTHVRSCEALAEHFRECCRALRVCLLSPSGMW